MVSARVAVLFGPLTTAGTHTGLPESSQMQLNVTVVAGEATLRYTQNMIKQIPKPGERVKLIRMVGDPCPVEPGSRGTVLIVQHISESTLISVAWDNGRSLSLIASIDEWSVIA